MTGIAFTFDGAEMRSGAPRSIAAALTEQNVRTFRRTEAGAGRSLFCGMGVCQDCLLTVDGVPNRRACMTMLEPGMDLRTQVARPPLAAPPEVEMGAKRLAPDVLILGGGAGGLHAAIAAREAGASVLLLDERHVPGGQYYKQAADAARVPMDAQQDDGRRLVDRARASGATLLAGVEVWGAFDGPQVMAADADTAYAIRPGAVVVATGAYEKPLLIPGWTHPGVMTVGAAQTLWRSYGVLPGRRVALAGNGPLVAQVALELARGGAEIVLLAEAAPAPATRPRAGLDLMRTGPGLAAKGLSLLAALRRRGVIVAHGTLPRRIDETESGLLLTVEGPDGPRTVGADAVCMNYGFQPQNEVLRLLGAEMRYDMRFEQLRPTRSETFETTVPGLWAVGDCCGIGGAPAAALEGAVAGRAAAGGDRATGREVRALRRARAFQAALWRLYDAPRQRLEDVAPETLVCRCEEVTHAALTDALAVGSTDIGAVKRATRIGMGRCQGRYCAPPLAGLMARRSGVDPQDLSFFAPRVPVKPVGIGTMVASEALLDAPDGDG